MADRQLNLFDKVVSGSAPPPADRPLSLTSSPATLDDATLLALLPGAGLRDAEALAAEAARRRLPDAVPALEALCRRFIGFGTRNRIPEQIAALRALVAIGGRLGAEAVARLIVSRAIQGPGLVEAFAAARDIVARLPPEVLLEALQHPEPAVREAACGCIHNLDTALAALTLRLDDLHAPVALAAACALGRLGRSEMGPRLLIALRQEPSEAVISALTTIADDDVIIAFGQVARARPGWIPHLLDALGKLDHPRADQVMKSLRAFLKSRVPTDQ